MESIERASFKAKDVDNIPKGAKILSKDVSVSVEEIENGFLVSKTIDARYEVKGDTKYSYITKKYFSKTNPLEINLEDFEEKSLADNFK